VMELGFAVEDSAILFYEILEEEGFDAFISTSITPNYGTFWVSSFLLLDSRSGPSF